METKVSKIYSNALGREMEYIRYGHSGKLFFAVPSCVKRAPPPQKRHISGRQESGLRRFFETLRGRSGQSMTPFKSIRYSGMTSLILSAINT